MILYEASINIDLFGILLPLAMFCVMFCAYLCNKKDSVLLLYVIVLGVINVFVIFLSFYYAIFPIIEYHKGNYDIVEGYVEEFKPKLQGVNATESFVINGIKFSYTETVIEPGYRKTYHKGGCIRGDGQHLKIGYITIGEKNAIIYIEELQ